LALASKLAPGIRLVGLAELIQAAVREVAEVRRDASPWLNVVEAVEFLRTTEHAIRAGAKRDLPVHRTATGRLGSAATSSAPTRRQATHDEPRVAR
jgi:hypothetical protein